MLIMVCTYIRCTTKRRKKSNLTRNNYFVLYANATLKISKRGTEIKWNEIFINREFHCRNYKLLVNVTGWGGGIYSGT